MLAHLRRDFKRFAYSKHNNLAEIGKNLLTIIDTVFRFYKLDLLHNLKIIEEFLGETKSSRAAYIDVREEQRGVSTTKLPIRLGYARGLLYKERRIDKLRYLRIMKKINERMLYYLTTILNINGCEHARRVAKNILKSFDKMWLFVDNIEIEPTNNHAERQIKHHVKYRKNSFFTWSTRGDRFLERTKSLFASSKLQCLNPFQKLINQLS